MVRRPALPIRIALHAARQRLEAAAVVQAELAATPGISARDAALIRRFFDAVGQAE